MIKMGTLTAIKLTCLVFVLGAINACSNSHNDGELTRASEHVKNNLIYLNEVRLNIAKEAIEANNPVYTTAYQSLIKQANKELKKPIDPVTNKTKLPDSGDIHDYHSLGAYYWPDPSTKDGLPWVYRDGKFNPINNSPATDYARRGNMLKSLATLNLAYYHSNEVKYLNKAKQIVHTWFVNPKTKMNPNLDYGKAIPGKASGTNFVVISWTDIGKVITTLQLLERNNLWKNEDKTTMNQWLNDYYTWLTTSEFGIQESTRSNNHGTNYDYQVIGLMLYLNIIADAEAQIENTKTLRIAAQIEADGSQPLELKRTKSVNYTVNNLWALARIADLGRRHTKVDLWRYTSKDGVSLKTGYDFVVPYINQQKDWQWKQITGKGAKAQLQNLALPMFSKTELMLGENILPKNLNGYHKFSAQDVLTYAPI